MIPSVLLTSLKEVAQYLGKKLDAVVSAVQNIEQPKPVDLRPVVKELERVTKAITSQKDPTFSGTVKVDQTEILRELRAVADSLRKLKSPPPSNKDVVDAIRAIQLAVPPTDYSPVVDAIKGLSLTVPGTFRLEQSQLDRISVGGAGAAPMTMATRVANTTVSVANASTEASYTFPSGTVGWLIKLRDQGTLGYYSWTTGKLPTSGDGTTYMTIPQNFLRSQQDVEYAGKTIYLGAEAAATYEIEIFRR